MPNENWISSEIATKNGSKLFYDILTVPTSVQLHRSVVTLRRQSITVSNCVVSARRNGRHLVKMWPRGYGGHRYRFYAKNHFTSNLVRFSQLRIPDKKKIVEILFNIIFPSHAFAKMTFKKMVVFVFGFLFLWTERYTCEFYERHLKFKRFICELLLAHTRISKTYINFSVGTH